MNRLAAEPSPYLLQHAANPVDWYPWGEEAFARARAEDKPIFLSVGYSTCHWCHVMEHESFEHQETADVLNTHFVSIKVDREERPDVDRVYMAFVQATTGSGGWPMSVWLTPDLKPFYGGTYYPPQTQWGRPGFRDVLLEIARAWREERPQLLASANDITQRLAEMAHGEASRETGPAPPDDEALTQTVRQFRGSFDSRRGGFGDAPKFPRPSELLFLLREHARTGDEAARDMVLMTLRAMALGGIRDHVGGGFHRYSVDGNWRVPHFEKMLYDQAQLVLAYLEAAQVSGDTFFAQIAEDTLQYVEREMTDPSGGFYSAEDADSVPPEQAHMANAKKMEGAFYIWPLHEVRALLGDDSALLELRYGLLSDGNAPFDPQNEFSGKNLLYTARGIGDIAQELGKEPAAVADALMRARRTLFEARSNRPRPHRDDKILTAWNGLMIAALARAARVLPALGAESPNPGTPVPHNPGTSTLQNLGTPEPRNFGTSHEAAAVRAANFIRSTMWDADRQILRRRYRGGRAAIDGYAEDYAFLIFGLLELFQANGNTDWLEWAVLLQNRQNDLFWDVVEGGWFSTTGSDPSVLLRMKEDYDGAEPSANSVGAWNLLVLSHLTADAAYQQRAAEVFRAFSTRLVSQGRALPMMSAALSISRATSEEIVVVGSKSTPQTMRLWQSAHRRYRPFATMLLIEPGDHQARLAKQMPWVAAMSLVSEEPAAYVCDNFTCERPVTEPEALL